MLTFIDISNWQQNLDPDSVFPNVDAVVCKATEGVGYVDRFCDGFVQAAKRMGKPFGFYHFAGNSGATQEADYFISNCEGYFNDGIPVLDWEGTQSVDWVNEFVRRVHDVKGVWCWIYANPWRFNQGGVESNCMRWVASYPNVAHPTFADAMGWDTPSADGLVGAWQFCSDGRIDGYNGNLDCNLFYGDKEAWCKYANSNTAGSGDTGESSSDSHAGDSVSVLENDEYKIMVERK